MSILSDIAPAVEGTPAPDTLTDYEGGVVYTLSESHRFFKELTETFTKAVSDMSEGGHLDKFRSDVAAKRRPATWFADIYDAEGKPLHKHPLDWSEIRAAIIKADVLDYSSYRRYSNMVVRVGDRFIVSRGESALESIQTVGEAELWHFRSLAYFHDRMDAAYNKFYEAHLADFERLIPTWATNADLVVESDGTASIEWIGDVETEGQIKASVTRNDLFEGEWDQGDHGHCIWLGPRDMVEFDSTDEIRTAAKNLLDAADRIDAVVGAR